MGPQISPTGADPWPWGSTEKMVELDDLEEVKVVTCGRIINVVILGWEDPLEKEMASHSSTLAWKSPWTEEPG